MSWNGEIPSDDPVVVSYYKVPYIAKWVRRGALARISVELRMPIELNLFIY